MRRWLAPPTITLDDVFWHRENADWLKRAMAWEADNRALCSSSIFRTYDVFRSDHTV